MRLPPYPVIVAVRLVLVSPPELIAQGYFDASKVDRDTALAIAEEVYEKTNANPMRVTDINDQALATACCPLPFLKGWLNRVEGGRPMRRHCVSGPLEWSVLAGASGKRAVLVLLDYGS